MKFKIFSANNILMENCFPELIASLDSDTRVHGDLSALSKVLLSNFVVHQGCYLLEYTIPKGFTPIPEQEFISDEFFPDRTGYECSENHLHTSDLLNNNQKGIHHLLAGIIIADNLRYKLKSVFPCSRFRIIVSFPVLALSADDEEIKKDCTVRFHAIREGEIIYDNLDDFKFEAMGIIEV